MRRTFPLHAAMAALLFTACRGSLEAQTWRTTSSTAWSDAANWGGALPAQDGTADLLFSQIVNPGLSHGTTAMDLDWNIHSITWNASSLDSGKSVINAFGLTTLTLQAGLNNGSGGRVEIYPNLVLGAVQTWSDTTTPTASASTSPGTRIYGTISGAGGIQKTGSGTLRLNSTTSSYSGGTVIAGGVLEVPGAEALGSTAASIQFDGGTLRFTQFPQMQINVALAQNLVLGGSGGTIQTRYGDVTLDGSIGGSGQLRLDADPSSGNFTQSRYTWSGAKNYAGGTVVGAVTVNILGTSQSLGTGGVTVKSDGVLALSAGTNLAPGQKVALKTGGVLVLNSAAINPANIIDSNPANTTGGILSLGADYGSALDMAALGNGQLFLGSTGAVSYTAATLGAGAGGVYRLGGGSGPNVAFTQPSILTFTGTDNLLSGARSVVIGSVPGFQTSEARTGTTVVFRNSNNYSGGTTLVAGTLAAGHNQSLGSGLLTIVAQSFTGHLDSDGGERTLANPVVFNSPAGAAFYFGGADNLTLTGTVNLGGTAHVFFGQNPRTTFTNTISNGAVTLDGDAWTLAGTNTFSGGLVLADNAALDFSSDGNLGAPEAPLTFQSGILRPTAALSTARPIVSNGGTIDTNGQTLILTGAVSGSGDLVKTGAGTLIFSGSGKTLLSATITQGTLRLDNNGTAGGLFVVVQDGGTLGGNGSAGDAVVYAGGHLAPGTNTPGTFRLNGDLNPLPGSSLDFDLGLTLFDKIILSGGTLRQHDGTGPVFVNVFDAGGLAAGQTYTLIDWTAGTPSTFTAADFQLISGAIGGNLSVVGKTLQLTTASVPEPGSIVLLLAGAGFLNAGKRRGPTKTSRSSPAPSRN